MNHPAALLRALLIALAMTSVACVERTVIEEQEPTVATGDDQSTDTPPGDDNGALKIPFGGGNVHALQIATSTCAECGPLPNPWTPDPPTSGPLPNPWNQKDNSDGTPNTEPTPPPTSGSSGNGGNSHKN